jgi:phosphoglycolate phosphatase-like HAD superfamily hydrolase
VTAVVFGEDALAPGAGSLWDAALEHVARRYHTVRPLVARDLPADRDAAATALDAWAGDDATSWRRELSRFYEDHARLHLRRDPALASLLRDLRGQSVRTAAYGSGPREASAQVFAFLGLERKLDAVCLEPGGDGFAVACAALGVDEVDARHVRTRAEVAAVAA